MVFNVIILKNIVTSQNRSQQSCVPQDDKLVEFYYFREIKLKFYQHLKTKPRKLSL